MEAEQNSIETQPPSAATSLPSSTSMSAAATATSMPTMTTTSNTNDGPMATTATAPSGPVPSAQGPPAAATSAPSPSTTAAMAMTAGSASAAEAMAAYQQQQQQQQQQRLLMMMQAGQNMATSGGLASLHQYNAQQAANAMQAVAGDNKVGGATTAPKGGAKRKTSGDGTEPAKVPKKASPKPRANASKAAGTKAEPKPRKSSPARGNAAASNVNTTTTPTMASTNAPGADTSNTHASVPPPNMGDHPNAMSHQQMPHELPPSQDNDLRKAYLQRIYRQLQITHQNHDDTMIRRIATNLEIEVCRRAATRVEYVAMLNQEINRLMQAELANNSMGHAQGGYSNAMHENANDMRSSGQGSTLGGASPHGIPSREQSSSDPSQRQSAPAEGSFMSLLSSQNPPQGYDTKKPGQFGGSSDSAIPHQSRPPYSTPASGPMYSAPNQLGHMSGSGPTDAQPVNGGMRPPTPVSAMHEFAAQFQHFDKNGLIELLWNQRNSLMQYQRRVAQLEMQLSMRQNAMGIPQMPQAGQMQGSAGLPSSYYNASPRPGYNGGGVPPPVSAEAEAQRANDRRNTRPGAQDQYNSSYGVPPNRFPGATPTPPAPQQSANMNPTVYWEKVRQMKEAYLSPLLCALQALSQHTAPQNSAHSAKAENVKHNISLASQILNEQPKSTQPRPFDVLESIERFIHNTVVPIVRKVQPQLLMQQQAQGGAPVGQYPGVRGGMPPGGVDPARGSPGSMLSGPMTSGPMGGIPMTSGPMTSGPMTSSLQMPTVGQSLSNANPPSLGTNSPGDGQAPGDATGVIGAPPVKAQKAAAKGGRKSPANSTKRTATPKATAKNTTKAAPKKSPARSNSAPQLPTATTQPLAEPSGSLPSLQSTTGGVDVSKDRGGLPSMKPGPVGPDEDELNDFSDFPELDFGDDLQDSLSKFNKENAAGHNAARKRSIEDV